MTAVCDMVINKTSNTSVFTYISGNFANSRIVTYQTLSIEDFIKRKHLKKLRDRHFIKV